MIPVDIRSAGLIHDRKIKEREKMVRLISQFRCGLCPDDHFAYNECGQINRTEMNVSAVKRPPVRLYALCFVFLWFRRQ